MYMITARWVFASFFMIILFALVNPVDRAKAEEWKSQSGGTEAGKVMLGMRAGFAPATQTASDSLNTSTDVGSLVNFQAMYSLNQWLLVGMMVEWERHSMSSGGTDIGHQDTVSVLPTVEVRPIRYGPLTPYVNMSFGVNVNSFGESSSIAGTTISPSNTFAWRLGWGTDYMITQQFALNAEMAYKRNDGHVTVNGVQNNDWNASSFGFLFGAKMFF
jgi:outer membrane protein